MSGIDPNVWVLRPRPNPGAGLRLFCLPFAGGGPQEYHAWPAGLPAAVEVCAVNLPGRGRRFGEPVHRRSSPLVDDLTAGLAPWLDRPFALFGHSMSALLAFELALAGGRGRRPEPVHRFVSGVSVYCVAADRLEPTAQLDPWRVHTTGPCDVTVYPDDHFFVRSAADELLQSISTRLSAVM